MAAYGAAISLLHALGQLLHTPNCPQQQIENLREQVAILRRFLEENREVKREFETQIRDAIYKAQDIIDSHLLSSEAEISMQRFSQDLERAVQNISSLGEMTTEEFNHQTLNRKLSTSVWKTFDEIGIEIGCTMYQPIIGRTDDINELMMRLMRGSAKLEVVPIVGIVGMGKTALAEFLLDNQMIREHFDATGLVTISLKYNKRNTLLDLLQSTRERAAGIRVNRFLKHQYNWGDEIHQKTDEQLRKQLYNSLKNKRYLILLDDIHNIGVWNDLKELFPDYNNGSRILITTRDVDVANIVGTPHQLRRLSDVVSLFLLHKIVFNGKPCPPHLHVTAKNIAWSCRGFPHAIFMVGKLLLCANPIAEYWEIVLSSINTCQSNDDIIEALLSLTYNHLPQQLKVCLLYMATFPYNDTIDLMELLRLWRVERFIDDEEIGVDIWQELCFRGFFVMCIMFSEGSSVSSRIGKEIFHDFLVRKAKQEKFCLVINKDTSFVQDDNTTYNQPRRLSIQQNIHLFFKDLSKKNTNSSTRSLVYHGPKNQYPLGSWSEDFKMVEVLDALKISFYTFPLEFLKSIQLRYLAFSYNGRLPTTVCNLRNLEVLIVSHYLNLKLSGVPSYLPVEIWNLKKLWHLQVIGSDLPEPPSGTNHLLQNLEQLSDVSAHSCAPNILERITKVRVLKVRIESSPGDESLGFFSHLNILKLTKFSCVVMYPDIGSQVVPCCILAFPSTLVHLTLSGCGFPWDCIGAIAGLPKLKTLKLQTYAFQGPQWEVKTDEFLWLKYLILEDLDLENWKFISSTGSSFPILESLSITHCYKLQHIPAVFADISTLDKLQVVDCSTSAMNSALEIKEEILSRKYQSTEFFIYSSRDD